MKNNLFVKLGCYSSNITMSIVGNLSPLLFLTFHNFYGISYSLLGFLVLVNFFTQLGIDLLFSFFSQKFNIPLAVKISPVFSFLGLVIYAVYPFLFPDSVYVGLLIGTILFSAGSGLVEVLISPVIAALPSKNPDKEMSKLHSVYAWGVVGLVAFTTIFFLLFGQRNWQYLALCLTIAPVLAILFFSRAKLPEMQTLEKASEAVSFIKKPAVWLCVASIFLGGASELIMAQWASGYLEQAIGIDKVWGDVFGVAMFALMLGLGRSIYAKVGRNITTVLLLSAIGATVCYLVAAISPVPIIGLIACALTGLCTSMMWPGNLIVSNERFPNSGVLIYALMASGGDAGVLGPQLVGIITDGVLRNETLVSFAGKIGLGAEQFGMRLGMIVGMLFPLAMVFVTLAIKKTEKKYKST